jgi:hypothetical protein
MEDLEPLSPVPASRTGRVDEFERRFSKVGADAFWTDQPGGPHRDTNADHSRSC